MTSGTAGAERAQGTRRARHLRPVAAPAAAQASRARVTTGGLPEAAASALGEALGSYREAARVESEARKRKEKAARTAEALIAEARVPEVRFLDGNKEMVAEVAGGTRQAVDGARLAALVDYPTFVKLAKVSMGSVRDGLGLPILSQVVVTEATDACLRVREAG